MLLLLVGKKADKVDKKADKKAEKKDDKAVKKVGKKDDEKACKVDKKKRNAPGGKVEAARPGLGTEHRWVFKFSSP